jgi:hypothetical protein
VRLLCCVAVEAAHVPAPMAESCAA